MGDDSVCVCVSLLPVQVCDDVFEDLVVDRRKLLHYLPQNLQAFDVVHDFWSGGREKTGGVRETRSREGKFVPKAGQKHTRGEF